jgi:hypothetical protein
MDTGHGQANRENVHETHEAEDQTLSSKEAAQEWVQIVQMHTDRQQTVEHEKRRGECWTTVQQMLRTKESMLRREELAQKRRDWQWTNKYKKRCTERCQKGEQRMPSTEEKMQRKVLLAQKRRDKQRTEEYNKRRREKRKAAKQVPHTEDEIQCKEQIAQKRREKQQTEEYRRSRKQRGATLHQPISSICNELKRGAVFGRLNCLQGLWNVQPPTARDLTEETEGGVIFGRLSCLQRLWIGQQTSRAEEKVLIQQRREQLAALKRREKWRAEYKKRVIRKRKEILLANGEVSQERAGQQRGTIGNQRQETHSEKKRQGMPH